MVQDSKLMNDTSPVQNESGETWILVVMSLVVIALIAMVYYIGYTNGENSVVIKLMDKDGKTVEVHHER